MCELDGCHNQGHELPPIILTDFERRQFLMGAMGLPLATILAFPELAAAQASQLSNESIDAGDGLRADFAIARPNNKNAPVIILIHEWWGLNDQIKSVAQEYANLGYLAIAVDMYGKVATNATEAQAYMAQIDNDKATKRLVATINYAKKHPNGNGKVATLGWCFGGGWSLNAAIASPVDATIIYYGRVTQTADQLSKLHGPVLGHFGEQDTGINHAMVDGFEAQMKIANKKFTNYWYPANHAFANPTGARYDEPSAKLAWGRTLEFLKSTIG